MDAKVFYTPQQKIVLDTLSQDTIYFVKKAFIIKKYQEVAPVMLRAYDWFLPYLEEHTPKPPGAEYPVWLYKDPLFTATLPTDALLKLAPPPEQVLLFDNHGWERVLSGQWVGASIDEEKAYDEKLFNMGIDHSSKVFDSPFYPHIKSEIIKSWPKIFQIKSSTCLRGATWCLKEAWRLEIKQKVT